MNVRIVVCLGLFVALLALAAPAQAREGACVPGGSVRCTIWNAKVVGPVNDGDTLDVRQGGKLRRIRLTAVQATELDVYHHDRRRGQCHAVEATQRLERILRRAGNRVRLAAMRPGARATQNRLLRGIAVRRGGRWRDVAEMLVREGRVFWMPNSGEYAWNGALRRAAQIAQRRGAGVWDADHCGAGPQQDVPLQVWAASDPLGNDKANVNGEWVKVRNQGSAPLALGGWSIRTHTMRRYTLPRGTSLAPGATLTLHVGRGTDRGTTLFWGLGAPVFPNGGDARDLGGGAFLFDPDGDLRAGMLYPCVVACSDPREGAVALEAQPRRPEQIRVRNVSGGAVDLYGLQLALPGSTYAFGERSVLAPGDALVVEVGGDPADDTAQRRHWGVGKPMLADGGGAIRLTTFTGVVLACDAWGSGDCIE